MTSPGLIREPSIIRRTIDHADDAAGQIVFAPPIHPGHLRSFAADQGATAGPAGLGKTAQDLREDPRLQFLRPDVIEKKERLRAKDGDVVDAVVDEVGADRVVAVEREGNLQLRPNTVDAADQDRLAHSGEIRRKQAAEAADFAEHLRPVRLPNESVDAALQPIAEVHVNTSARVSLLHGNSCRSTAPVANRF